MLKSKANGKHEELASEQFYEIIDPAELAKRLSVPHLMGARADPEPRC